MTAISDQLFYYDPADYDGSTIPNSAESGASSSTVVGARQKVDGTNFSYISFSGEDGAARLDLPAVGEYTYTAVLRLAAPVGTSAYMHFLSKDDNQLDYLFKRLPTGVSTGSVDPGEAYHFYQNAAASEGVGLIPPMGKWMLLVARAKAGVLTVSITTDEGEAGTATANGVGVSTLGALIAGTYSIGRPTDQASRNGEGIPFDLGPFGFFDREITGQEETDLFNAIFFPPEQIVGGQASRVSGTVSVDGVPSQRIVRAFSYSDVFHSIDGTGQRLSKSLGHATSNATTGEYAIDLLSGYKGEIFVVAFDDYGDDFTPDRTLSVGNRIHPTEPNGHVFECTGSGDLPTEEPTWIIDTENSTLYGTASMIAKPFYRPMVQGPIAPEITVPPWTPQTEETVFWFDAQDEDTITTDISGNVELFEDKSGNGHNLTQSDSSLRPKIATVNGFKMLDARDGSYRMVAPGVTIPGGDMLISVMVEASQDIHNGPYSSLFEIAGMLEFSFTRYTRNDRALIRFQADPNIVTTSPNGSYATAGVPAHVLTIHVVSGEGVNIKVNGITIATLADPVNPAAVVGQLMLFDGTNFSSVVPWQGLIGEIFFEPTALSTEEAQIREGYIAHKWGIADKLPDNHPYRDEKPYAEQAWIPANLFGGGEVGAWYDPSDLSTMFQDLGGTIPVSADGDPVALLMDKSGNGFHLFQDSAGSRPIYKTDGSIHWIQADGVDDFMISDPLPSIVLQNSGFAAAAWFSDVDESVSAVIEEVSTTASDERIVIYADTRSDPTRLFNYSPSVNSSLVDVTTKNAPSTSYISVFNGDGSTAFGRRNAVDQGSAASNANFGTTETRLTLLRRTLGPLHFAGRFYGGVVIDRQLLDTERDDTEQYLAEKSGVTL